jgi:propanol-preferring alcohol dehydrogenase
MGGHCGYCENCRRGDFVNCQNQPISGTSTDGGYAEMMITQASSLAVIPNGLLSTEAAPLLCAGLTTFNRIEKLKGSAVAAIARGPEKESLARKLGAHHYIDSNAQDPVAALQTLGGARLILAILAFPLCSTAYTPAFSSISITDN